MNWNILYWAVMGLTGIDSTKPSEGEAIEHENEHWTAIVSCESAAPLNGIFYRARIRLKGTDEDLDPTTFETAPMRRDR